MRASKTHDGLTLRAIAGANNVILAMDLADSLRAGCLGFAIQRTDLMATGGGAPTRWLPNFLKFPSDLDPNNITTDRAPLQKFRWGDYTLTPGCRYRYRVEARYGKPGALTAGASVEVEILTESQSNPKTAVFFNRAAAASAAYQRKFGDTDPADSADARAWLSRGLEEALVAYLGQATDSTYSLHGAVYEFQKPNLLAALAQAAGRGVAVDMVYHHRVAGPDDDTWKKNDDAVAAAGLTAAGVTLTQRSANPQGAIMHNKFVVLLKNGVPQAVWTGSTNWTDGGLYGQLNVGHAVYDPAVASKYDGYFALLKANSDAHTMKTGTAGLTPVPGFPPPSGITSIFSPESSLDMLDLYAGICGSAHCLMVCAPFELHKKIVAKLETTPPNGLHFMLLDKAGSLGTSAELGVITNDMNNEISVAVLPKSPLHDFQNRMLEGKESFHHAGVHIHSKIILADPFGSDPILVTGSANYSNNSTASNDENSLVIRGDTGVADIYATEFMRMFEHYHFRASRANAEKAAAAGGPPVNTVLTLDETDSWSADYYVDGSKDALERRMFAGTL